MLRLVCLSLISGFSLLWPCLRPADAANAVPVVMASGALQKCLGIEPGTGTMTRGPSARQYCNQLPASDLYDQAGRRYQSGDHAGAANIVTRAAEAGNALAQLRLALLYDQGDGVPRSARTAFEWYSRAAAQGDPESQNQVGLFYELGEGVPENWDLAVRLFQASAQQGWMKGQFSLGRAYQFGIGVPQNRQRAIGWFRKAGAQGNSKGDYWAKWLRDSSNNIGFRDDTEHNLVLGGKLRFSVKLAGGDPFGITFHNSAQRILWLAGQRNAVDRDEAEVFRLMKRSNYDSCSSAGRDNCGGRPQ